MAVRILGLICIFLLGGFSGCTRDTPEAALERAVSLLQENLEAKRNSAVLEQLHPQFRAQQQYERDWAKRTMLLLFLRHKNVKVIALGKRSQLDPTFRDRGRTTAEVTLAGAEGLIPDSARHYRVRLEWWLEDGEWQLARLDWE
ncbi:hypothetical protein [Pseudomonas sp. N040]|uniref:hypothetical protein n=1 Tax=Pseudomonas sp. N040 TaxID=2785325 RepID=UPI0018A3117C|nr:hypothetical protein [Pseudomonas sp. N040]MBF7728550.1 hypothetical protein [Pseudomonas sp. N040]MBW7012190.1 hypothetical protein [Pseudomonas sp. N040]